MLQLLFLIVCLAAMLSGTPAHAINEAATSNEKFAVYYSDKISSQALMPYHLVVLDGSHHPSIPQLKENGKVVLGYLSIGEVDSTDPHFAALNAHKLILMENKNWKGSYFVDIRDPMWPKIVIEEMIPNILRQGFDGIFLDTIDNPIELEDKNVKLYAGMTDATVHLIEGIRLNFPSIKIMMNRGYPLLPKVAKSLNMELGESVYTDYNFDTKTYQKTDKESYQEDVKALKDAQKTNTDLKVYTLDYANPSDLQNLKEIYRTERANGFIPYVSTIGLDQIVPEPNPN